MSRWSILFLLLTLLFAGLGFSGAGMDAAAVGGRILFVACAVLFVMSLLVRVVGRV